MIVVDVNVIAYLLIEGEHTDASAGLLAAEPAWAAPLLWRSEWRNILAGYLRRGELDRAGALERVRAGAALVEGREYLVEDAHVLDLVASFPCSAYVCEYVALADALAVPLVTFDRGVLAGFPGWATSVDEYLTR